MKLIVITITYDRPYRIEMMQHLKSNLDAVWDVEWIVVEDAAEKSTELAQFLPGYARHFNHGPTRDFGHEQRNLALEYIQESGIEGIVYNADDDNQYHKRLFDEILKTKRISMFPVGNLGPYGIERPVVINGNFFRWEADWQERKFPVDMAGFAFHTELLKGMERPLWNFRGRGGESEFLSKMVNSTKEVEFLCKNCTEVLVYHNELRKLYPG
jgi:hypothetical protein